MIEDPLTGAQISLDTAPGKTDTAPIRPRLDDIDRPYSLDLTFEEHGIASAIDGKLVMVYKSVRSGQGSGTADSLLITRPSNLFISFDGWQRYRPSPQERPYGVQFMPLPVFLWPGREVFYIGDQYKVEILDLVQGRAKNRVKIDLSSTEFMKVRKIPRNIDYARFLETGEKVNMDTGLAMPSSSP